MRTTAPPQLDTLVVMPGRTNRRSNLAVILLTLLTEEPMHAYRMQRLITERGKDNVVNVAQRNSVYQTIERLLRTELITVREVTQHERRPDRTVYEITPLGRQTLQRWLADMVATQAREFPEFPAALASLPALQPAEALAQLDRRAEALAEELAALERTTATNLPRMLTLDDEHRRVLVSAELAWVRSLVEDLRSGALTWNEELLRTLSTRFAAPESSSDPE